MESFAHSLYIYMIIGDVGGHNANIAVSGRGKQAPDVRRNVSYCSVAAPRVVRAE